MASAREKRGGRKQNVWRIFNLFYSKADHRRSGTSHNHADQLKGGLQLLEKRGLCVSNGVVMSKHNELGVFVADE